MSIHDVFVCRSLPKLSADFQRKWTYFIFHLQCK